MSSAPTPPSTPPAAPSQGPRPLLILLPLAVFGALAVMFAYALTMGDPSRLPSTMIGKPVPELTLPPLEGLKADDGSPVPGFSAADLRRGEITVVNFFASWCVPCAQEHPYLVQLARETGVKIYGVNYKDPLPGGRRFIGRWGNPYAAVGTDDNGRGGIEWGVYGMPETFIVDGTGHIIMKQIGPISAEDLQRKIIPVITAGRANSTAKSPTPG